jgi:hypothetical protein
MLRSESLKSKVKILTRASLAFLCFLLLLPFALGQSYTLQMAPFPPPAAIDPGGASAANVTLVANNGFNGTVDLSCQVTSQTIGTPPTCEVSPPSVQPSGGASVTVTGAGSTTPAQYTITVTGTATGTTPQSQSQHLTVLAVSPQFTITVQTAVAPSSVPAGSGGEGVININPINGYITPPGTAGGVTLSCASITPLVAIPPICSFNPQPVKVSGVTSSTLTISTAGPVTTGTVAPIRGFYALWMPLPMFVLVGLGAAVGGKRWRKAWGLLALLVVSGSLLLTPACGNSGTSTTTPNGVTPANSYTFTVVGVDAQGNVSSNTTTTGANPTVSLTVTAPTTP